MNDRLPLSPSVSILFGVDLLARLRAAAGPKGVARFVREAVEEKLARESEKD